ncbi:disease resistance protein RUN1-like [Rosa rugosa]|uniref:disease resistance protein RUN1-like n=1 Tax=Rosa rugosa TaxID=74645 RepID=UPI002B410E25|nr:disease resistance protein RUN1-like [Rosa rugosa]
MQIGARGLRGNVRRLKALLQSKFGGRRRPETAKSPEKPKLHPEENLLRIEVFRPNCRKPRRYLVIKNGNLPNGLECLPDSLRILEWTGYPSKSLPSHFNPEKLLELNMCHSCIEHFPLEIEPLYNLKTVKLSNSLNLVNTRNFKGMPHLELLFLEGCTRLYEVDPGIEVLEKLTVLKLKDCKNLVHFASRVRGLKSLKVLNLSGCSKLKKLPNDMGHLESLVEVDASGTSIQELPCSIGMLEGLVSMSLRDCKHLVCLPGSVGGLKSLKDSKISIFLVAQSLINCQMSWVWLPV